MFWPSMMSFEPPPVTPSRKLPPAFGVPHPDQTPSRTALDQGVRIGGMSDLDTFREPQRHFAHVEVEARHGRPWREAPVSLSAGIVGAGRAMDLHEFLEVTATTALLV